jgi:pimeloyl-ACP methyl ester carboxylesterase
MQVVINGKTMNYEEHGSGPAVLLLHGVSVDRRKRIQPLNLAGYRVIVPDLYGSGESAAATDNDSTNVLSDDIVGLLDYLGIGRVAIVSLPPGSQILRTILQRYPHRLAAAAFVKPLKNKSFDAEIKGLKDMRSGRGDFLVHFIDGTDVTRSLIDFFNGVKRFRLNCQKFRMVA